jgi:hypothetical protein
MNTTKNAPTSRRAILAGTAAAVALGGVSASIAAPSTLQSLIAEQRRAFEGFEAMCRATDSMSPDYVSGDDPAFAATQAKYDDTDAAETAALTAVCAYPCKTMEEVRIKGEFLAKHFSRNDISNEQFDALMRSFSA